MFYKIRGENKNEVETNLPFNNNMTDFRKKWKILKLQNCLTIYFRKLIIAKAQEFPGLLCF
jgi:hypothetical protein